MNVEKMPLSSLRRPDRNVRMHTEKQLKEFERSVSMFGQIRPIVVDESMTILAGNGLYETLLRLGWDHADVLVMPELTANQKRKLMLADNKIFGLGVDDLDTFDAFLAELQGDLDIPGYDESILQSMVSQADEVTQQLQQYGTLDDDEIQAMHTASERKEQMMSAPSIPEPSSPPMQEKAVHREVQTPAQQEEPAGCYVVCPKCGEKIWL